MTTATVTAPRPGSMGAWIIACRPKTLAASIAPVVVGTALAAASGRARFGPALSALFGALLIQIATNLWNDVFDHESGADTATRIGPMRATQSGVLTAAQVRAGALLAVLLSVPIGIYLALVGGWPVVAIGIAAVISGLAYTAGPFPLGYHGLGEAFVFVFFGLVAVAGTVLVQTESIPTAAWPAGAAVGSLASAVLVVNNLRDRQTDALAGKRTLAVRFGAGVTRIEYALLVAGAYGSAGGVALLMHSPYPLLALTTVPLAAGCTRAAFARDGAALNDALAATARLLLIFGVALAAGITLANGRGA